MRDKTQLVELDLRSGLFTNDTPWAIGPRLWQAYNAVWDYRYPRAVAIGTEIAPGPWMLRMPLTFPTTDPPEYLGVLSFRDIAFTANQSLPVANDGVILLGCNATNQYTAWGTGGMLIPFAAGVPRMTVPTTPSHVLGCSTWWQTPGKNPLGGAPYTQGIVVFSHMFGAGARHIYYLLDSATEIRSLTMDVVGYPTGAAALAVHLDRLWMISAFPTATSLLYTDPFDITGIDPNNEIIIAGNGRCLIPGQLGTVDSTGVPHLVIGHEHGIQVLDGDPNLGNAALRTLAEGIGMQSSHVAAVTPYGVYFVGTDMDLYQIPLGMQEVRSVGGPWRDRIAFDAVQQRVDTTLSSLVWFNPYLYFYPGGQTMAHYVLEPSRDGIAKAWGPMSSDTSEMQTRTAVVRAPTANVSLHAPTHAPVPSVHSIDTDPIIESGIHAARYLAFDQQQPTAPSGRQSGIVTGLVNLPGHAIQPMRVLVETVRVPQVDGADVEWFVALADDRGNSTVGVRVPEPVPPSGVLNVNALTLQHFVFPKTLPAMRGCSVSIFVTAAAELGLVRAFLEVKASPLQF